MAVYTRQSSSGIVDGGVIEAVDLNNEFDQLASAFLAPTFGVGTAGTDIVMTFDGETNDGVLTWMEDEDLFKFSDAINVGVDDTGHDVKFFGATSGKYMEWDESADQLDVTGSLDVTGNTTMIGTLTIGVDDAGHDVKFFGDTASAYMLWDTSTDDLVLAGAAGIDLAGDIDVDGTANLDNTDIDGTLAVDGTTISLDATTSLNIDNSNTSNGITLGTATSGVPISIGHTTSEVTINDNLTTTGNVSVGGNLDVTGTFDMSDANITNIGSIALDTITNDGTDITLDSSGDIVLDAGGANVTIKDDGTSILDIANSSTDVEFTVSTADKNFKIKGTDGASAITALDIDMALAGKATFNGDVVVGGDLTISGDDLVMGTNTSGHILVADGTNFNPVAVGDLSEISTVANDDVLLAVDTSGGGLKKITRSAVVSGLASSGAISNVVEDTSPQLGSNLDTNSHNILIDDAHFLGDENGNEQIIFQTTSSAVNQFDVTNAASGSAPSLKATGDDSNIDLELIPKGTGHVTIKGNTNPGTIQFNCEANSHGVQLKSPAHSAGSSAVLTLPTATGNLIGSGDTGTLPLAAIDIDGGTDIGADIADADLFIIDDAAGGTNRKVAASRIKTYIGSSVAADDIAAGDAAVTLTTSSGNIVIDAAANDSDIVFKGTDGGADTTFLTIDGSAAGAATFNDKIIATELDISGNVDVDGTLEADAITIDGTAIASVLSPIAGGSGIVTTGALNSGSITSGFGTIDTGSSTITTTGLISGGSLDIDNVLINGTTIGHTDDTDLITVADSLLTVAGDVTITGGTPTLTIGDAGAEDTKIVFDGNAQDFYIALDDSADDLLIGLGSTVGTTPAIAIDENLQITTGGDIVMGGATPTLTIGDAGAEDAKIVFDGNAQDFHIGLDDSADDLVIGLGSALGTTPAISIDENLVSTFGAAARGKTLTAGSQSGSVTLDFNANQNFVLTATGNVTLANPSTEAVGQSGIIVFIQDGTGSRTLSTGTDYETPAAAALTISTAANAIDVIPYFVSAANSIKLGAAQIAFG